MVENIRERPDGVIIASCFIVVVLTVSGFSRWQRSTELRASALTFSDEDSGLICNSLLGKKANLVPVRTATGRRRLKRSAATIG
jgi:hypothetical protein